MNIKRSMFAMCVMLIAGSALISLPGCSKKSVQSGGDSQSTEKGMARSGGTGSMGSTGSTGVGSDFPATGSGSGGPATGSGSGGDGGLRGFDSVRGGGNPAEERVGSGGTMIAKSDPSSAARQMEDIRREQVAATTAGLKDVFFAYDSWTISEDGRQALMHDAEWINANLASQVKIEGHCDERGTGAYNLVLGEKRAKAVRNYLVELGVSANRLSVVSYGKERPFCSEHAESCYQQNRRGHIVLKTK